jgi:hypothetical protein
VTAAGPASSPAGEDAPASTAARLELTLLGLLSWCDRILLTAALPDSAGAATDGPFLDAALGVVALRRQLHATLSAAARGGAPDPAEDDGRPDPALFPAGMLR